MRLRAEQWIEGLKEDWCISRQRFFGVPIPVWYSEREEERGKVLMPKLHKLPIDPLDNLPEHYARDEVIPDPDVLDTWATSSLSPLINARGLSADSAKDPARFNALFPADLRPQAHEIIRSWAFYTIAKAQLHQGSIPWKHLMISGWCLASDKTKMSKSKGNIVTPVALIREKGADAVRYWASTSRLGADTAFSEESLKIGRKLVTKLWNAALFAGAHLTPGATPAVTEISATLDRWIVTRLAETVAAAQTAFDAFEYCDARMVIETFFWQDFCDNYLELVKARAYGETGEAAEKRSACAALHHCFDALLRLFAPFLPHVTEELHQHLFQPNRSVHARGTWPQAERYPRDEAAKAEGKACVTLLGLIRKAKSERGVSIKYPIETLFLAETEGHPPLSASALRDLAAAGAIGAIQKEVRPGALITEEERFTLSFTFADSPPAS
jgi:valyl-tRNA synthetase